ncbi:MAG: undecaprenyl-phosphate glucose phosphotransferase [Caldilineae bacterium]|nr:MAG: undecaprenyl-phosphate glucose phosphotransferase [Caldilineae bacterium]
MKRSRLVFQLVLLGTDFFAAAFAVFVAHRIQRALKPDSIDRFLHYSNFLALFVLAVILVSYIHKRYHGRRPANLMDSFTRTIGSVTTASLVALAALVFLFKNELDYGRIPYPRGFLVYTWAGAVVFISLGRFIVARFITFVQAHGYGRDRVLVVGSGEVGRMLVQKLQSAGGIAHEVVGFVPTDDRVPPLVDAPILGRPPDLPEIIDRYEIDEVVIGMPEASHREIVNIISLCEREKVSIKVFPDVFQIMATEVGVSDLGGLPLLTVRDVALSGWRLSLKRVFDLVFAGLALIFLSPLMLLIALLVKLESPGPVFYIQERMGLDARPFPMLKFRSMRADAERDGPGWTTADDPRKTRLGAILRRISIDELPQLINVIRADMSLVGPRPERPVYVEQFRQYIPRYMDRHQMKAGITGWAQVNGLRGDTSIVERTKYDLWYIENWSLWLDFKICVRTLFRIFTDRNAY